MILFDSRYYRRGLLFVRLYWPKLSISVFLIYLISLSRLIGLGHLATWQLGRTNIITNNYVPFCLFPSAISRRLRASFRAITMGRTTIPGPVPKRAGL